jgi:hypothetical protein
VLTFCDIHFPHKPLRSNIRDSGTPYQYRERSSVSCASYSFCIEKDLDHPKSVT